MSRTCSGAGCTCELDAELQDWPGQRPLTRTRMDTWSASAMGTYEDLGFTLRVLQLQLVRELVGLRRAWWEGRSSAAQGIKSNPYA